MHIPGAAVYPPSGNDRKGVSFAESMREQGATPPPSLAFAKSFQVGDLATSLGFVSPDFVPAMGEGMLDAIALGKGASDEMRRYEELTKYR